MAITIDPTNRRLILDTASTTAQEIYSSWAEWMLLSDNSKYPPAFNATGGDDLGGGLYIPPYYFLLNGWRVRPMESSHLLVITGNLFVEGGGQPVVQTLGSYNVSVQYTVPVQAQAFSVSGGSSGLTPTQDSNLQIAATESARARKLAQNKAVISGDTVTLYDDDGVTILQQFNISPDKSERVPV